MHSLGLVPHTFTSILSNPIGVHFKADLYGTIFVVTSLLVN